MSKRFTIVHINGYGYASCYGVFRKRKNAEQALERMDEVISGGEDLVVVPIQRVRDWKVIHNERS